MLNKILDIVKKLIINIITPPKAGSYSNENTPLMEPLIKN